ncbi:Disulfide-bond oxidoreductase YfcG [Roseivivax jejudonensis]|uniref:Disulfide-bond oxidoreductase YfcG n=1 Tax=Roseivivax jejudonensis TaxID=1529041 RepID=A0A1X7A6U2_9RHOB|nr:glutathione S-transferase N-terminal domain-containing protein [Roseivivax jejudonensis]SLN71736.1 Disulfide-bond oxidoreductase YfcG [Roseivivax jejudonensis]
MFDLYTHATPNGYKVSIALEELGYVYSVHPIYLSKGQQFEAAVREKNPNAKIPILVDRERDVTIYESQAILLYLAQRSGQLFPDQSEPASYWDGMQKLFFASASIGPMFGQRMHFSFLAPETVPYGIRRYEAEGDRLMEVCDSMLSGREYFLGEQYSIVDIAVYGWIKIAVAAGYTLAETPNLLAWFDRVDARRAVRKGLEVPARMDPSRLPRRKAA